MDFPTDHIDEELLRGIPYPNSLGPSTNKPPVFSALKKDGKRLYEFAREGLTQVDVPS